MYRKVSVRTPVSCLFNVKYPSPLIFFKGEMGPKGEQGSPGRRGPTGRSGKRGKQVKIRQTEASLIFLRSFIHFI